MGSIAFSIHLSSPISHCTSEMYTGLVLVQTYRIWSSVRLTANWSSGIMAAGLGVFSSPTHPILFFYVKTLKSLLTLVFLNTKKKKKNLVSRKLHKYLDFWLVTQRQEIGNFAWALPRNSSETLDKSLHFSTCQWISAMLTKKLLTLCTISACFWKVA